MKVNTHDTPTIATHKQEFIHQNTPNIHVIVIADEVSSGNSFVCQGRPLPASTIDCRSGDIIQLSSITVYTDTLESAESCKFTPGTACDRKIQCK